MAGQQVSGLLMVEVRTVVPGDLSEDEAVATAAGRLVSGWMLKHVRQQWVITDWGLYRPRAVVVVRNEQPRGLVPA